MKKFLIILLIVILVLGVGFVIWRLMGKKGLLPNGEVTPPPASPTEKA